MARKIEPQQTTKPKPQRSPRGGVSVSEEAPDIGGVAGPPPPRIQPEPPYILNVKPERWGVIEGRVVPICAKIPALRGVNGVGWDEHRKRPMMEQALAMARQKGGIPIPWDVDGPGRSYLRKAPGGFWISQWETVYAGSDMRTVDSAGYADWLRSLIDRGIIPGPALYILEALAEQLRARMAELHKKGNIASYQVRIDRTQRDLDAVMAEMERVEAQLQEAEAVEAVPDLL